MEVESSHGAQVARPSRGPAGEAIASISNVKVTRTLYAKSLVTSCHFLHHTLTDLSFIIGVAAVSQEFLKSKLGLRARALSGGSIRRLMMDGYEEKALHGSV